MKPKYYECGICGGYHPADWDGDCREDAAKMPRGTHPTSWTRKHGARGWEEVPMPGTED